MTAMTAQLIADRPDDKLEERWANDNMMGRVSLPWEYKGPAIFLASDASAFCTGMDLRVDGGHCGECSFFLVLKTGEKNSECLTDHVWVIVAW